MSALSNGGPAFPNAGGHKFTSGNDVRVTLPHPGMTLRDYFAAQAMQTLLRAPGLTISSPSTGGDNGSVARVAYAMADAMIAAREGGAA